MNNVDNEIIIKSKKSDAAFESFQIKTLCFGAISILIWLFPVLLGAGEADGVFTTVALVWASVVLVIYFIEKSQFKNVHWVITSKGVSMKNNKNGTSVFVATDHISSVSVIKGYALSIVTNNAEQPTNLLFLANAREMESVLKDLIYKTDKQKDVHIEEAVTDSKETDTNKETVTDNIDELIKYKKLLDLGIITQEEFDVKKKQLLNL